MLHSTDYCKTYYIILTKLSYLYDDLVLETHQMMENKTY
jgi:hypothetical protein